MIGVVVSTLIIGQTTLYLHETMEIGSQALPAPQATLMSTIIKGLLSQNLPWGLVLTGVFLTVTLELCGIHRSRRPRRSSRAGWCGGGSSARRARSRNQK